MNIRNIRNKVKTVVAAVISLWGLSQAQEAQPVKLVEKLVPLVASEATMERALELINTGVVSELVKVKRIGKVTAERIVEFRLENGPFTHISELAAVKGIGAKIVQNTLIEVERQSKLGQVKGIVAREQGKGL